MHKRALLLTVATFAVLSGPAFAATITGCDSTNTTDYTDITTKVSGPLCTANATKTGTAGDITIETDGSVIEAPVSGTTATITPPITINSNNLVTNNGLIQFSDTTNAIGVQLDTGHTGAFDMQTGTINMNGGGTDKTGILITDATSGKTGTFTGILIPNATDPATTVPTAIDLESGSILEVTGDGSTGVELSTNNTVKGDIDLNGSITMTPTSSSSSTAGAANTGVSLLGTLVGDLHIGTSGTIAATGAGAQGVWIYGATPATGHTARYAIDGEFLNEGSISVVGTATPNTNSTTNLSAGSALLIQGGISDGIINQGPSSIGATSTVSRATISETGDEPAVLITPQAAGLGDVKIGVATDPNNADQGYSLLNRGTITAGSPNDNVDVTAMHLSGDDATDEVILKGGIFNGGTIAATAVTNSTVPSSGTAGTVAVGIDIDNFATVNGNSSLVNSDESNSGSISASVSGAQEGVAEAILINSSGAADTGMGNLKEIDNDGGTIEASATTTDNTIGTLSAFAIRDLSGSLSTIINSGTISATVTTLTDNDQIAEAIDAAANTSGVSITNSGTIEGDIILGQGTDHVEIGVPSLDKGETYATVTGNLFFGGTQTGTGNDVLAVNENSTFTGQIEEPDGYRVDVAVASGGTLNITNNGTIINGETGANVCPTDKNACGVQAGTFTTQTASSLSLGVAQVFNVNSNTSTTPGVDSTPDVVNATSADIASGTIFKVSYGSFITSAGGSDGQFVLIHTPNDQLTIGNFSTLQQAVEGETPFLFSGTLCTVGPIKGSAGAACTGSNAPSGLTGSNLVLNLDPKTAAQIGLTGSAAKMFSYANTALANDTTLGGAVISAGLPVNGTPLTQTQGQALYQKIYSAFAPDVTGSARAIAISITDDATGVVAARQRELRMYAGQETDTTLWGQEYTQTLNIGNKQSSGGYDDTGFGFALGVDGGDPMSGRFGAAFQFYSGDTTEKSPRVSRTDSDWYMITGYSDWRGKGLFLDAQASAAYASLTGNRVINVDDVVRDAQNNHGAEMIAAGATTGVILAAGGTTFMPELSLDGMTMREEGYTESSSTSTAVIARDQDGFDLTVQPSYMSSVRGFAGADLREDLNFGGFYLQPEARAGYRYDFIDGAEKVKAAFVSEPNSPFTLTGPDPARGNFVLGGGLATTTGAWSLGVSYDYVRGVGGQSGLNQVGTVTLVGRM